MPCLTASTAALVVGAGVYSIATKNPPKKNLQNTLLTIQVSILGSVGHSFRALFDLCCMVPSSIFEGLGLRDSDLGL